jgi:uncharacterized membrane protein
VSVAEELVGRGGDSVAGKPNGRLRSSRLRRLWYVLLLLQFPAVLVPSFYARATPQLWGFPFFYWYQLLWVIVGAVLTAVVYVFTRERAEPAASADRTPAQVSS